MNKSQIFALAFALFVLAPNVLAEDAFELESQELETTSQTTENASNNASATATNDTNQVLSGEVISISSGAKSNGSIDRGFTSDTSRVGDRGYFVLEQSLNGIPSGSKVEFEVSQVSKAKWGRFKSPGEIQLKAVSVVFPDGRTAKLNGEAFITNDTGETVLKGSTTKDRVKSGAIATGVGAGTGALSGLIGAAIGGGAKGKSTAIGTAIGGGVGLAAAAIRKGKEVNLKSGDKLFLLFTQDARLVAN